MSQAYQRMWQRSIGSRDALLVAVKGFDWLMLGGELSQVAMDVVGITAMRFQLDRHVFDAEVGGDPVVDRAEQRVGEVGVISIHQHMGGEHDEPGLHGPDMEIVHILYARQGLDGCGDL